MLTAGEKEGRRAGQPGRLVDAVNLQSEGCAAQDGDGACDRLVSEFNDMRVNGAGEVYDYRITAGPDDAATRQQVETMLLWSRFEPARRFGRRPPISAGFWTAATPMNRA